MVQIYTYLELFLDDLNKQTNLQEFSSHFKRPHQTVRRHLDYFVKKRVLIEEQKGKFLFYKINFLNPLVLEHIKIAEISKTVRFFEQKTFNRLYDFFHSSINDSDILIFGSAVHQEKYNDIDILIVKPTEKLKERFKDFEGTYSKEFHIVTSEDYNFTKVFLKEVRKKHILISGTDRFVRWLYGQDFED